MPRQFSLVVPIAGFSLHWSCPIMFQRTQVLPFDSTIVNALGFEKVIKYKDDNITHFKHYDHFYLLRSVGILKFPSEIVDPALLASPELLLAQLLGIKVNDAFFVSNHHLISFCTGCCCSVFLRLGYHTWLCERPFAAITQLLSMTCTST